MDFNNFPLICHSIFSHQEKTMKQFLCRSIVLLFAGMLIGWAIQPFIEKYLPPVIGAWIMSQAGNRSGHFKGSDTIQVAAAWENLPFPSHPPDQSPTVREVTYPTNADHDSIVVLTAEDH